MKHFLAIMTLMLISATAQATSFECTTYKNLDAISSQFVETKIGQRLAVDETEIAVTFLKQTSEQAYSLEVYLPQHDMRVYSEATLANTESVITASVWMRDMLIEVSCRQLQ